LRATAGSRPSGTENLHKLYAESFKDEAHLDGVLSEAQEILGKTLEAE
jgi:phosphoglucomutase